MKAGTYKIIRDHDNTTGFYAISVPEYKQWGLGFSFYWRGVLRGAYITNR
jgi:hypothetical protein